MNNEKSKLEAQQEQLDIPVVRLSLPDRKLFNKFKHKEYGGLDLAYRLSV